jgi:hypothetical protein
MKAVIAPENDEGVVDRPTLLESVQYRADAVVDKGNAGQVGLD